MNRFQVASVIGIAQRTGKCALLGRTVLGDHEEGNPPNAIDIFPAIMQYIANPQTGRSLSTDKRDIVESRSCGMHK